jgi:hypothetical protein
LTLLTEVPDGCGVGAFFEAMPQPCLPSLRQQAGSLDSCVRADSSSGKISGKLIVTASNAAKARRKPRL